MSQQHAEKMAKTVTKNVRLDYLLYLPDDYREDADQKWPLILFLHGFGQRGFRHYCHNL